MVYTYFCISFSCTFYVQHAGHMQLHHVGVHLETSTHASIVLLSSTLDYVVCMMLDPQL